LIARMDAILGVWKAPAGTGANLKSVASLERKLTDVENGRLNPRGVNCLRSFPASGIVAWGARTLAGEDQSASEFKYIPVRRTALFIEESVSRGIQWAAFEPNGQPLWDQIRLTVGIFLNDLFRAGAFQGSTPRDAYLIRCDSTTTTQNDIDAGVVNVVIGFAPMKPAEFVIIRIRQFAAGTQP
jgi:phage tail sheath protein FI